jgi:hypothetical protein
VGIAGGRWWDQLTNGQWKAIWNCHNESPLYKKYILIKNGKSAAQTINKYINKKFKNCLLYPW